MAKNDRRDARFLSRKQYSVGQHLSAIQRRAASEMRKQLFHFPNMRIDSRAPRKFIRAGLGALRPGKWRLVIIVYCVLIGGALAAPDSGASALCKLSGVPMLDGSWDRVGGMCRMAANNCCDCPPTATDQQCFLQCNALIPRCRAPAPRAVPQPTYNQRPSQTCSTALTGFCCGHGVRYYSAPSEGLRCPGDACYVVVTTRFPGWYRMNWYVGQACW